MELGPLQGSGRRFAPQEEELHDLPRFVFLVFDGLRLPCACKTLTEPFPGGMLAEPILSEYESRGPKNP